MANYSTSVVSAITDIPALVGAFAQSIGWSTDLSNPNQPIVEHPGLTDPHQWRLSATVGGTNNQEHVLRWDPVSIAGVNNYAATRSPRLNGSVNNPNVPAPTQVHMFGDISPEPYLAVVIEYGFNLYRHLYYGYLEKHGTYEHGEVLCGNCQQISTSAGTIEALGRASQYLFSGNQTLWADTAGCGGAFIEHADNPTSWRRFKSASGSTIASTQQDILGGGRDTINAAYTSLGASAYSGAAVLVPYNLYVTAASGRIRPVGCVVGARMVRMDSLDPGTSIVVGNRTWKVFPEFAKSTEYLIPQGTQYRAFESSLTLGVAYLEDEGT